ncbi:MAG: hypothetical protein QGI31_11215, partial [Dehalococcoidia bacterium]|nr:hypothetical protein [Dehalococcoidia bacterium]
TRLKFITFDVKWTKLSNSWEDTMARCENNEVCEKEITGRSNIDAYAGNAIIISSAARPDFKTLMEDICGHPLPFFSTCN